MKLGCSTILYGKNSLDDALRGIKKAGYQAIELCSIPGMGFHVETGKSAADYRSLKKKIRGHGLAIESIGASGNDPYDPSPNSKFRQLMAAAAELGAPCLALGSGGKQDSADDMERAIETFNRQAEYGREIGVKISIKPHVGSVVYHTPSAHIFMQQVDSTWVGLNVDASHLWRAPVPEKGEESIPKLAEYIVTGRIRDTLSHERPIGPVETQVPGGGAMNLKGIMDAFKRVPGLKTVTLEIVGTADWPLEKIQDVVERSHRALAPLAA